MEYWGNDGAMTHTNSGQQTATRIVVLIARVNYCSLGVAKVKHCRDKYTAKVAVGRHVHLKDRCQ